MTPASRNRAIAFAMVAVLAAAAAGWWSFGEHQRREQRKAVVALLSDTGTRLHSALGAAAESADAARKLEEHAAAVERNLAELKRMNTAREPALAEAADDYLLTSREILKRLVNMQRYHQLLSESLQALIEHMHADNHTGAWVQQAVKARERANRDHRDLGLAAGALDQLLQSFPGSQKRIAPYVEAGTLIESSLVEAARTRALETARQATADIEKTRKLDAFR